MRPYVDNSPEAKARLLTALMAADDRIDDAEIEALGALDAYARLGISPAVFADVLRDYFVDLNAISAEADLGMRINTTAQAPVVDAITEPDDRQQLWEMMVGLARADGDIVDAESAFLRVVAERWWVGKVPGDLHRVDPGVVGPDEVAEPSAGRAAPITFAAAA
ncbi:MAG: TerB family tellurite resistance protein [Proteobacteria bacterium]|nr:TerB family tellurite resistance protein [Burkholderiales bacterium]